MKTFEYPELKLSIFTVEDVVTTSGGDGSMPEDNTPTTGGIWSLDATSPRGNLFA